MENVIRIILGNPILNNPLFWLAITYFMGPGLEVIPSIKNYWRKSNGGTTDYPATIGVEVILIFSFFGELIAGILTFITVHYWLITLLINLG